MATRKPRRKSKKEIKAAADRAEARSKGEEAVSVSSVLEPEETASVGRGRPPDYSPELCQVAADACARGATMEELADIIGVNQRTLYRWRAQHADFCLALKVGREMADERVGFSLYERAVGYTFDTVKITSYEGSVTLTPFKEHVPPDVGAQKFWLTNRRSEEWQDRSTKELTGAGGGPIEVVSTDKLALARWIALQLSGAATSETKVIDVSAG